LTLWLNRSHAFFSNRLLLWGTFKNCLCFVRF